MRLIIFIQSLGCCRVSGMRPMIPRGPGLRHERGINRIHLVQYARNGREELVFF